MATIKLPPFEKKDELVPSTNDNSSIPNKHFPVFSNHIVQEYISKELSTPIIDEIYDKLWLVAAKPGYIDPLHQHEIKLRSVLISEDLGLHLVWYYKTVYLKPIPHWLLNHDFWTTYLLPKSSTTTPEIFDVKSLPYRCRIALGFLRSYARLICHESDFFIAQDERLIPKNISYATFQAFIAPFLDIPNQVVAPRYHYGQLRLTRLNIAVRLLRPSSAPPVHPFFWHQPWHYRAHNWQTALLLERWAAPLLFIFAAFSLILSSMQVVLQALGSNTWESFVKVSWAFSVAVISFIVWIGVCVLLALVLGITAQLRFALRHRG